VTQPAQAYRPRRAWAWAQGPGLAIVLFAVVLVGGTLGYMVIERWNAWDAFYMTAISVTTVGYREVHEMSWAGQAWTTLVLFAGVGTLFYTASIVLSLVVEGGFSAHLHRRWFNRMLNDIEDHFIICGYGRIGSIIADEFRKQGVRYVIVDRDPDRVHEALERGDLAVEADASREDVLVRIGIHRARGLIAAVRTDAENVYTVLSARVLNPGLFIIARIESEDAEPKLKRAGADRVISPYQLGGIQMAATALRPAVVDFMRLATSSERLDLSAEQVEIRAGAPFVGQTLREANVRQKFGVIVVAIKRPDGRMQFNPEPGDALREGDQLVALGSPAQLKALEDAAQGVETPSAHDRRSCRGWQRDRSRGPLGTATSFTLLCVSRHGGTVHRRTAACALGQDLALDRDGERRDSRVHRVRDSDGPPTALLG
jgi:voltage-gated potassium channel